MTLPEQIFALYPELTFKDLDFNLGGTIQLRDDADGKGPYIYSWEHPVYPIPTDEELALVNIDAP